MNSRDYILETGDIKFNCEYMENVGENRRFKKDAPCIRCKNHNKCKIYLKDHNRRMYRKMIANIGKQEKSEIKEVPKVTFDPEVYLYSMGLNFLFDYKESWKKPIEPLYLNVEWVRIGKGKRGKQPKRQISMKLREAIKDGNIPILTLEQAKESNKSRLQKKLKALGGKVPVLEMEI